MRPKPVGYSDPFEIDRKRCQNTMLDDSQVL